MSFQHTQEVPSKEGLNSEGYAIQSMAWRRSVLIAFNPA